MIYAAPGATFEATLDGAPTGLVGTMGVRLLDNVGGTTLARTTAGIAEFPAGSGHYTVTLTAPSTAGQYSIFWDNGTVSPTTSVSDELTVTYTGASAPAPSGRDLCTLADVRALMQKKGTDTTQDSLITSLITRASVKVMRDYGREFVPGGPDGLAFTAATRTFEYQWGEQNPTGAFVSLAPYDLRLTPAPTINVDTDQAQAILLTTDEYRLWPQPPRLNVFEAIKIQPVSATVGLLGWSKRQIQVTGTWGFPSIPLEVTQATAEVVMHWITAYPAVDRPGSLDEGASVAVPRGYPLAAIDLLRSFERMTI